MFKFLSKSESCDNEIDPVYLIHITISIILLWLCTDVMVHFYFAIFKLTAYAQSIYK